MNVQLSLFTTKEFLSVDKLKQHADELAMKHWGVAYTGELKLVKTKWKSTNGQYMYTDTDGNSTQVIIMSSHRNAQRTPEKVSGTLLHELVHWRMHQSGLPFHDDDTEFIKECYRVGAPISGVQYAQKTAEKIRKGERDENQKTKR